MSTQTVYFDNPATITSLQTTTVSMSGAVTSLQSTARGTVISYTKVATITPGAINQSAGSTQMTGPNVPVDVYKVIYVSTDPRTSSNEWLSGTICIPQTISKNTIYCFKRATQVAQDDESLTYEYVVSSTWNSLAPTSRPVNNSTISVLTAGLGYVSIQADGFGLGVSPNALNYLTYFGEMNPSVDLLRATRNLILSNPSMFYNYSFPSILPVVVGGNSAGAAMCPGIAMEFQTGVSDQIPAAEAACFSFKRIVCGAPIDPVAPIVSAYLGVQTGATGAALQKDAMTQAVLYWSIAKGIDSIVSRPSSYGDIWPLYNGNFLLPGTSPTNGGIFTGQFNQAFKYNYAINPPVNNNYYAPQTTGALGNFVNYQCYDQRQILDLDKFYPYVSSWYNDCALTSIHRPLYRLENVPIAMVYTSGDEYINNLPFVNPDTVDTFIPYLTTGSIGSGYAYSGANKVVTKDTSYTGATLPNIDAIATSIATVASNNTANIYKITATNDHTSFLITYGPRLQFSVLKNLPSF